MNNLVYGKTMKNVRKCCNITIVNSDDNALKHVANPSFDNLIKINYNFITIMKFKNMVNLDKPSYVGTAVLDYYKLLMYRYYYGVFKKLYGDKVKLLMTDTDSLLYEKNLMMFTRTYLVKIVSLKIYLIHQTLKKQTLTIQK